MDKAIISVWLFVLALITAIFFLQILEKKTCYNVEIEFTDGTKRTIQFESIERPKVTSDGCVYDYSKKSWICGCRDIQYKECN